MNRPDAPPPAITPGKLATIAALAVVLVIVLVIQFSGPSETVVIKKRRPRNASEENADTVQASMEAASPAIRIHWPEIRREEVAEFNPFLVPDELQAQQPPASPQSTGALQMVQTGSTAPSATTGSATAEPPIKPTDEKARIRAIERKSRLDKTRATANELQKQGVGLVLRTSAGAVARIGGEEVRVGDVINGVLRIKEINADGLVVEEVTTNQDDVTEPRTTQTEPSLEQ
jgi:hypothetical protein